MKRSIEVARSKWLPVCCIALAASISSGARADDHCVALAALVAGSWPPVASAYQKLGDRYERDGQLNCAITTYQKQVSLNPEDAAAHTLLGSALQAAGHRNEALAELHRAVRLDPSSKTAHLILGVLEHEQSNQAEALAQWQEVVRLDPDSERALDWIAKTRIEAHQYTAAIDLLSSAPDTEELVVDRVVANSQAGLYEQAIAIGKTFIERHGDWPRLRMSLATVLVQRNRFEEAIALLQRGVQMRPNDTALQVLYLRVLVLTGDVPRSKPFATEFLKQHPKDFDGLYLNGLLEREDGAYESALIHLEAAEALKPNHFDVLYNLGATLAKLHRPEDAKAELEKAMMIDDTGADIHFQLAGVFRSLNDPENARKQMELYQQKLSDRALRDQTISLAAQAAQKLAAGDAPGAIEAENEILRIRPDDAVHYYDLSLAEDRAENFPAEQAALEHAVLLRPDFATAYNQLGYLAIRRNDAVSAEGYFKKAIASAPQFAEAESNLGSLLANQGRDAEAESYFRSAVLANPRYTVAWINLAASLAARSMFEDARDAIRHALQVEPNNPDAAQLLALLPKPDNVREHQP